MLKNWMMQPPRTLMDTIDPRQRIHRSFNAIVRMAAAWPGTRVRVRSGQPKEQRKRRTMIARPHSIEANPRQRGCDGVAAIEFAAIAPILLVLLTGVGEVGIAAHQRLQVEAAAEAGALYAVRHGDVDLTAIGTAVVNGTSTSGISATPAPVKFCGCPTTSDVVSQGADCTTVCPDTRLPGHYVTVSATITHQTLLPYLNLAIGTLAASSTIRVK